MNRTGIDLRVLVCHSRDTYVNTHLFYYIPHNPLKSNWKILLHFVGSWIQTCREGNFISSNPSCDLYQMLGTA